MQKYYYAAAGRCMPGAHAGQANFPFEPLAGGRHSGAMQAVESIVLLLVTASFALGFLATLAGA
jgi:hypothetical protein